MNNMQIENIRLQTQLLQLHRIKKEIIEREFKECRNKFNNALDKVNQRKSRLNNIKTSYLEVEKYSGDSNRFGKLICQRQFWLHYDMEEENYHLKSDELEAEKANEEYENAKLKMFETLKRLEMAVSTLKHSHKLCSIQESIKHEREYEDFISNKDAQI